MEKTTSREFVEWIVYIAKEEKENKKEDYYLAQIATEIRRSYVKDAKAVKIKDFLLSFEEEKVSVKKKVYKYSKEELEGKLQKSKNFWASVLGLKEKR